MTNQLKPDISDTFNKCVKVEGEFVSFTHGKKEYRLTGDCLTGLNGLTVLVNSAFEVNRSGIQIGKVHQV